MERREDIWLRVGLPQEKRHVDAGSKPDTTTAQSARQGQNKRRERQGEEKERKGKTEEDSQMYLFLGFYFKLLTINLKMDVYNKLCHLQVIQ